MHHPITDKTVRITLSEPFDYLSAGQEYLATPYSDASGYRIDRTDNSGGTTLRPFQWQAMLASGIASIEKA